MVEFTAYHAVTHPLVKVIDDWNSLLDHGLEKAASYVIRKNGATYEAINGSTGKISFSGANAATVINSCITALSASGGTIFIKNGQYDITASINLTGAKSITLTGETRALEIAGWGTRLNAANGLNSPVITSNNGAEIDASLLIKDLIISGNSVGQGVNADGIYFKNTFYSTIENVYVYDAKFDGFSILQSEVILIKNCYAFNNKHHGFYIPTNEARLTNCQTANNALAGIFFSGFGVHLNNVLAWQNAQYGIIGNILDDFSIVDCDSWNNAFDGINIDTSTGGRIIGCESKNNAAGHAGILLVDAIGVLVLGNQVFDDQGAPTQDYGIYETGTSNYNVILGNRIDGCVTSNIRVIGANTKVKYNQGFVTENRVPATITAAATSIVVPHLCDYTPAVGDIHPTLTNLPTNDIGDVYVDTIGAANFTLHCRNVPGGATAIFDVEIRRTP